MTTELQSLDELEGVIEGVGDSFRSADLTETLEDFHETLEKDHGGYFDRDQSPSGDTWPALSPATIAKKGHD